MGHTLFLKLTCDIGKKKSDRAMRHATLPFLKIDTRHWGPPIKGLGAGGRGLVTRGATLRVGGSVVRSSWGQCWGQVCWIPPCENTCDAALFEGGINRQGAQ